jgi:hypothetical protein
MLEVCEKLLIERLRVQTLRTKTAVLAINGVPIQNLSSYLAPISQRYRGV